MRTPKSKINPKNEGRSNCSRPVGFGIRLSAFFRNSEFGIRIFSGVVLLLGAVVLTGCTSLSSRVVTDPAPAVARLKAGASLKQEVDLLAQPLVDSGEVMGLAVGTVTPSGGPQVFGYGRTGLTNNPVLPDGKTIFQIGSLSKLFVASLLAVLVEEGTLRYEDTVRDILPPEVKINPETGKLTLYELVTHTGGLPREPVCLAQLSDFIRFLFTGHNLYTYIDKRRLYLYLRNGHPKPNPERLSLYSNFGVGMLAHLIEVKTGRSFPELLEEKICRPLNLRDTGFVLNAEQQRRLAKGHAGDQPRFLRRQTPLKPWDMGEIMRASGAMYSTPDDMLVFVQSHLGLRHLPLDRILSTTQRVQCQAPDEPVAFGWRVNEFEAGRVKITYIHGMVAGYTAYMGMDTERGVAVVVLSNTFNWNEKVGHNLMLRLSEALDPKDADKSIPSPRANLAP
ncbi:MAG: serine hydrolase domain-containing protein [Verrucomicrobiota bacterium]